MNAVTLACVVLCLSSGLEARTYGNPYRRRGGPVTPIIEPFPDPNPGPFPPIPQSPIPCRFGLQLNQQGLCTNFLGNQQCAAGFVCLFGPADEPGPCCLRNNPCRSGNPFQLGGNAVSCDRQSCPSGFRCNRGRNFAVCCPDVLGPNPGHDLRPCPNIFCAAVFIEPECRKEVITSFNGVRCLGCPQNICINNNGYPRPGPGGYEG
uniref:WAP domain-containing protein n=2 Tax=Magallana gigas TaxID=29159 RepID=A0A8W8MV28_MAGGI|nr:uncharacterized protein LOC105322213 [Crassostrea gigas]